MLAWAAGMVGRCALVTGAAGSSARRYRPVAGRWSFGGGIDNFATGRATNPEHLADNSAQCSSASIIAPPIHTCHPFEQHRPIFLTWRPRSMSASCSVVADPYSDAAVGPSSARCA